MEKEKLDDLSKRLADDENAAKQTLDTLKTFARVLYDSIEYLFTELNNRHVTGISAPQRNVLDSEIESLRFSWKGFEFLFVPFNAVATPSRDECRVDEQTRQTKSGRLVVFMHPLEHPEHGDAVYFFDVFSNGTWSAWGLGYPVMKNSITSEIVREVVLKLIDSLLTMPSEWNLLKDTKYAADLEQQRTPLGFKPIVSERKAE